MKTSYIYLKIASLKQYKDNAYEIQKAQCLELAKKTNIKVLGIYEDLGKSGMTLNRKGLQELLRCCKYKHVNYVIVFSLAQLTRNVKDYFKISTAFEKKGIRILSVTNGELSTSHILSKVIASAAQYKSEIEK